MSRGQVAWVVYDSVHGNTRTIAEAIGEGLAAVGPVRVVKVDAVDVADLGEARLLVLGCPTHAFSTSPAMKAFAAHLSRDSLDAVPFAVFDTRFALADMPSPVLKVIVPIVGKRAWAATHLARAATKAGGTLLAEPEGFFVRETEGPLVDGERERASSWARRLATSFAPERHAVPAA